MNSANDPRFAAVGIFAGLAGAVVLDEADDVVESALREGRFERASDIAGFLSALARGEAVEDELSELNRAILVGDAPALLARAEAAQNERDETLAAHLRAVAYRLGSETALPEPDAAVEEPDAFVEEPDAAVEEPDAAPVEVDAGSGGEGQAGDAALSDAGIDAGSDASGHSGDSCSCDLRGNPNSGALWLLALGLFGLVRRRR